MQTSNHYVAAVRSFARWLVDDKRLESDPLAKLKLGNVKKDLRRNRRTLPLPELTRLFQATAQSKHVFRGLAGPDRLALYLTACGTGFRAGELAVLGPESFDLDGNPPMAYLPAREDKAGRSVKQPLPPGLVQALARLPGRQAVWPAGLAGELVRSGPRRCCGPTWRPPASPTSSRERTAHSSPTSTLCGIRSWPCWTGAAPRSRKQCSWPGTATRG